MYMFVLTSCLVSSSGISSTLGFLYKSREGEGTGSSFPFSRPLLTLTKEAQEFKRHLKQLPAAYISPTILQLLISLGANQEEKTDDNQNKNSSDSDDIDDDDGKVDDDDDKVKDDERYQMGGDDDDYSDEFEDINKKTDDDDDDDRKEEQTAGKPPLPVSKCLPCFACSCLSFLNQPISIVCLIHVYRVMLVPNQVFCQKVQRSFHFVNKHCAIIQGPVVQTLFSA